MKKPFILLAIGLFLVGCASTPKIQPHRQAFYKITDADRKTTNMGNVAEIATGFSGFGGPAAEIHRRQQKAQNVYPECGMLIEKDLWNCVREIDIKEGRITADYVEPQGQNMDELNRNPKW